MQNPLLACLAGCVWIFGFFAAEATAQKPLSVWATGDGVRVNPVNGRYLEDRTDIHEDYPSGDYQDKNLI